MSAVNEKAYPKHDHFARELVSSSNTIGSPGVGAGSDGNIIPIFGASSIRRESAEILRRRVG